MGARLQAVGEKIGHFLPLGLAACAPLQQGDRVDSAQQNAGPLGSVQSLVPRHGDKRSAQGLEVQGQAARGLGGIHNQGHAPGPAEGGDIPDGQDKTKDVGYMGTHRQVRPPVQLPAEGVQRGLLVKERSTSHPQIHLQGVEGPGDSVVLIAGDHHPAARTGQGLDGDIEAVGGVEGKGHPLRVVHVEQPGRRRPAGKGSVRSRHGGPVAAPARAGQMVDSPGGGGSHAGRLLQGGGGAVQIDHRATS